MEKTTGTLVDKMLFLKKFFVSPKKIGSITPSSLYLARAMTERITWEESNCVIELGAGTGVFTSYLHEAKPDGCTVLVFEQDGEMRQRLQNEYANLHFCQNAEHIHAEMQAAGIRHADYILSGLPFANFPQSVRNKILDGVVQTLKPGGQFIAFQYSLQMKKQLKSRFANIDIKMVPLNIPPAFVYYCQN